MNFLELKSGKFIFVDTVKHYSSFIFAKTDTPVKIDKFYNTDNIYQFIGCRTKDIRKFKEAMRILEENMEILGYDDYPRVCKRMFQELKV